MGRGDLAESLVGWRGWMWETGIERVRKGRGSWKRVSAARSRNHE